MRARRGQHRRRVTASWACALACALALSCVPSPALAAPANTGFAPRVIVTVDSLESALPGPRLPGPVFVTLLPQGGVRVRYRWDSPVGTWNVASGPIMAPSGSHTLFAAAEDASGDLGPITTVPIEVVYPTAIGTDSPAVSAEPAPGRPGVTFMFRVLPYDQGMRTRRLGGADRYETASMIASGTFASADTVVIATGLDFPDALSATGLAGCLDAAVLLARPHSLHPQVREEIERLGASNAVIVGGTGAVGTAVADELRSMGLSVSRIGGATRYDTAALVAEEVVRLSGTSERLFIARGDDFADALSLGSIAYRSRSPLLLTAPTALPSATRSVISRHSFSSALIAGGTGAVSAGIESEVGSLVGSVRRVAGATRYDTSAAIARWGVEAGIVTYGYVGLATGAVFPDALCGAAAAGNANGVVILTRPDAVDAATQAAIDDAGAAIRVFDCYGGTGAVSNDVFGTLISSLTD